MTGSCPCCGGAVALDVPPLTPSQMRLLLVVHRAGDSGIVSADLIAEMGVSYANVHVQMNKLRTRLSGSGVGIEMVRRGQHSARYRIVRGDY